MLILVCGLPGTGKSSFSKELSKRFHAVHLNSDVIRKKLTPKPTYSVEEKTKIYTAMAAQADGLLGDGKNVILDATFFHKEYRDMMREVAGRHGVKIYIICCVLGEYETKSRIMQRKKGVSDADYEVYLKLKKEFEPIEGEHLEVNTSLPLKKRLDIVKDFIEGGQ